jgi:hypothetical protein
MAPAASQQNSEILQHQQQRKFPPAARTIEEITIGGMPVGYDREFDDEQQRYWPRQQANRERGSSGQLWLGNYVREEIVRQEQGLLN